MKRRNFLEKTLTTSGALLVPGASIAAMNSKTSVNEAPVDKNDNETIFDEVVIERPVSGKPHLGKVLAVIQPHCDDIPIFAGGTVAKLIDEGYGQAKKILTDKIDDLHKIAKALITYETLSGEEIENIINKNLYPKDKIIEKPEENDDQSSALGAMGLKPKIVH